MHKAIHAKCAFTKKRKKIVQLFSAVEKVRVAKKSQNFRNRLPASKLGKTYNALNHRT